MATKYTVTITKVETDVPYTKRTWVKVVDVPDEKHEEIYRYVDSDAEKDIETKIYEQEVEDLDLPEVIKAVNGMSD
jgi:hypothetical protein